MRIPSPLQTNFVSVETRLNPWILTKFARFEKPPPSMNPNSACRNQLLEKNHGIAFLFVIHGPEMHTHSISKKRKTRGSRDSVWSGVPRVLGFHPSAILTAERVVGAHRLLRRP